MRLALRQLPVVAAAAALHRSRRHDSQLTRPRCGTTIENSLLRHERGARLAIRYRHGRLTYDNYLVLASNNGPYR